MQKVMQGGTMDNPTLILVDALTAKGLSWDDIVLVSAGISYPEVSLDMAEWIIAHPEATWQEMMQEKTRVYKKYQIPHR